MKTRVVAVCAVVGLVLLLAGWRGAGSWADRGTVVATQAIDVPGAPPWGLTIDVPVAAKDYLLESTVTVDAPADRSDVTASPELRAKAPNGPAEVQPAEAARTVVGRGGAAVTTHAWLRVGERGPCTIELINLHLQPADPTPRNWRVRLAEGVPAAPGGNGLAIAGFVLLAMALLAGLFWPARRMAV